MTPEQRSLRAKVAAHARWAQSDPRDGTQPARAGFMRRFEKQVDPDGALPPLERARRAESAMRSHMAALALKSSTARGQPRNDSARRLEVPAGESDSQETAAVSNEDANATRRRTVAPRRGRVA